MKRELIPPEAPFKRLGKLCMPFSSCTRTPKHPILYENVESGLLRIKNKSHCPNVNILKELK